MNNRTRLVMPKLGVLLDYLCVYVVRERSCVCVCARVRACVCARARASVRACERAWLL